MFLLKRSNFTAAFLVTKPIKSRSWVTYTQLTGTSLAVCRVASGQRYTVGPVTPKGTLDALILLIIEVSKLGSAKSTALVADYRLLQVLVEEYMRKEYRQTPTETRNASADKYDMRRYHYEHVEVENERIS